MMMTTQRITCKYLKLVRQASSSRSSKKKDFSVLSLEGEIISGVHSVRLALESTKRKFYKIYYCPKSVRVTSDILEMAAMNDVTTIPVTWKVLDQLSKKAPHKGVCADVSPLKQSAATLTKDDVNDHRREKRKLWLLMCSIGDPQNLGAIIRTAYFLGIDDIFTCSPFDSSQTSSSLTPSVSRASAGVLEIWTPKVVYKPEDFLQTLSNANWRIIGGASTNPTENQSECYNQQKDKILIVGNEGEGLPESITKYCNDLLVIPPGRQLHPLVDSLNVSVATALLLQRLIV